MLEAEREEVVPCAETRGKLMIRCILGQPTSPFEA